MKNKQIEFLICFLLVILTSGCAKYRVQHTLRKEAVIYAFEEHKKPIDLSVRAFEQEEFKNYLSKYHPLALTIKNKTGNIQKLAIEDITLPLATLKELKKSESKIFCINFIPSIMVACLGFLFWWQLIIPSVLALGAGGWQLSIMQHERAGKLLKQTCCFPGDTITIEPYSSVDKLVFVKKTAYKPRFSLTLQEQETNTKTIFNVLITARTSHAYTVK